MRHSRTLPLLALALLGAALVARVRAGEEPGTAVVEEVKAYALGEVVADFEGPGPDGKPVRLSDLAVDADRAQAVVLAEGRAANEGQPVTLETRVASLSGLLADGEVDEDLHRAFLAKVGRHVGLVPGSKVVDEAETLGDLVTWIRAADRAPILVMVWSPRCPMCKNIYDERVQEILGETGVRLLAVAGNYPDKPEHVTDYLELNGYAWKVVMDPEQKIVDRMGGRKTPHLFLLDADRHLRYRGTVDNDPRGQLEDDERLDYFRSAIEAVTSGKEIPVEMNDTEPAG